MSEQIHEIQKRHGSCKTLAVNVAIGRFFEGNAPLCDEKAVKQYQYTLAKLRALARLGAIDKPTFINEYFDEVKDNAGAVDRIDDSLLIDRLEKFKECFESRTGTRDTTTTRKCVKGGLEECLTDKCCACVPEIREAFDFAVDYMRSIFDDNYLPGSLGISMPEIHFDVDFPPATTQHRNTFLNVRGETTVSKGSDGSDRYKVTLFIGDYEFTRTSLFGIFYIIFHEVLCHCSQSTSKPAMADPHCIWTEGFMDRIAILLVEELLINSNKTNLPEWIRVSPREVLDVCRAFHMARHSDEFGHRYRAKQCLRIFNIQSCDALNEHWKGGRTSVLSTYLMRFGLILNAIDIDNSLRILISFYIGSVLQSNSYPLKCKVLDVCSHFSKLQPHAQGAMSLRHDLENLYHESVSCR